MTHIAKWLAEGQTRHQAGDLEAATGLYKRVLSVEPANPTALFLNSVIALQTGKVNQAVALLEDFVARFPDWPDAFNNLSIAYQQSVPPRTYEAQYQPDVHTPGREAALAAADRALALRPGFREAHNNRALCLLSLGRYEEALIAADESLRCGGVNVEAMNTRGMALHVLRRFDEALSTYGAAIALRENTELYRNRARCLNALDRLDEALADCRRAIALAPESAEARVDTAVVLQRLHRFAESIDEAEIALRYRPDRPEDHADLAVLRLLTGDFAGGWPEYEWRLHVLARSQPYIVENRWQGPVRPGMPLLVRAEQGFGDTFQLVRLLPYLAEQGPRITFECQHGTLSVLQGIEGCVEIVERPSEAEGLPYPDMPMIPLASLPLHLGLTVENIPSRVPYIHTDRDGVERWRSLMDDLACGIPHRLRVGIRWSGSPRFINNEPRATTLAALAPLATVADVLFFSLQTDEPAKETANPPPGMKLIDLAPKIRDWADTAAILENLDLLISVDTGLVHLAGAIGKPAWVLLSDVPDWRWLLDRDDSPWYPTLRLFRQTHRNDWTSVVLAVRGELDRLVASSSLKLAA